MVKGVDGQLRCSWQHTERKDAAYASALGEGLLFSVARQLYQRSTA